MFLRHTIDACGASLWYRRCRPCRHPIDGACQPVEGTATRITARLLKWTPSDSTTYPVGGTFTISALHLEDLASNAITATAGATFTHLNTSDQMLLLAYAAPTDTQPEATSAYGLTTFFQGRTWHADLGAYYYRNRWYLPETGEFAERDPVGYSGSGNPYEVVGFDTANAIDPSGRLKMLAIYFGGHQFSYKLEFETKAYYFGKYVLAPVEGFLIPEGTAKTVFKVIKIAKKVVDTMHSGNWVTTVPSECHYFIDRALAAKIFSITAVAAKFEKDLQKTFERRVPSPSNGIYYSKHDLDVLDWVVQVVAIRWLKDPRKHMDRYSYNSVMNCYAIDVLRKIANYHAIDMAPGDDSPRDQKDLFDRMDGGH